MLTLRTSLDDCRSFKDSGNDLPETVCLKVFDNAAIVKCLRKTSDGFDVWVGETADPFSNLSDIETRINKTRHYDEFDGIRVGFVFHKISPSLVIARTIGGTSPIYVSTNGSRISISWSFNDVVCLIDSPQPNVEICRLVLEHGVGQTREQVIQGVFALWPGEKVIFQDCNLTFSACEDIHIVLPSALSDRGQATDAFLDIISSVIEPAITRSKRPLLEFSGGMDSTCVALAASVVRDKLESYSLIQPGAVGRQQNTRRKELIDMLSLTDYTGLSSTVLPIESLSYDECQMTPYDDSYRMSILHTLDKHNLNDVDLVVSGLGGDELAKDHTYWRYDWETPGYTSRSALVSSMSNFDMFMKRGVWPLNPLAHPRVVNFCRALPEPLRKDRLFNRLAIARRGLSDGYLTPRYHETFANVLFLQAIECDIDSMLASSVLADYGIIDVTQLLSEIYRETELGLPIKLVGRMYYTCKLEVVLRRYVK